MLISAEAITPLSALPGLPPPPNPPTPRGDAAVNSIHFGKTKSSSGLVCNQLAAVGGITEVNRWVLKVTNKSDSWLSPTRLIVSTRYHADNGGQRTKGMLERRRKSKSDVILPCSDLQMVVSVFF